MAQEPRKIPESKPPDKTCKVNGPQQDTIYTLHNKCGNLKAHSGPSGMRWLEVHPRKNEKQVLESTYVYND
jgi:hypothetical protein